jgi:uncharacterized protein (DUF885 family)
VTDDIARLADEYWEYRLDTFPTQALMLGDHRNGDRMERFTREAEDAHIAALRDFVARAEAFDPGGLTPDDEITREVLIFLAGAEADVEETRPAELEANPTMGFHALLPVTFAQLPLTEPLHAEQLVDKLADLGRVFDEAAQRLREGVASGRTPIDLHVEAVAAQIDAHLDLPASEDPYLMVRPPAGFDAAAIGAWRERLAGVLAAEVRPAMQRYRDALRSEVLPAARDAEHPGLCHLADGEESYARAIRRYVTLEMEPADIHRIGLEQIERLVGEYRSLGGEVLGITDLTGIFEALRNDPDLHFASGPPIVAAAEAALAKARAAMGEWFGRLPEADCVVGQTPSGPIAFYFQPAADGSRPGTFYVNTSDPSSWGTFQIESMAFHEGIPGHHLQLAIAQELDQVPAFRRNAFISAYGEGWALYTERLADEMGLYGGPLERIGMLWGDSMRACRLVVDTGLHAMGWSRQQAIDYVSANSPMAPGQVASEVDRYIGLPGQALSYMIGRLEVQRLRAEAEAAMGERFDIAGFHDVLLGSGVVPLETLGRMVRSWVAAG